MIKIRICNFKRAYFALSLFWKAIAIDLLVLKLISESDEYYSSNKDLMEL